MPNKSTIDQHAKIQRLSSLKETLSGLAFFESTTESTIYYDSASRHFVTIMHSGEITFSTTVPAEEL